MIPDPDTNIAPSDQTPSFWMGSRQKSPKRKRDGLKKYYLTPARKRQIDHYVGSHIQQRRLVLGMSKNKLANLSGLSPQMIEKFEHGSVDINASDLFRIAGILKVSISYFFEAPIGGIDD